MIREIEMILDKPDKSDLMVQVDDCPPFVWPFCVFPWCPARVCFALSKEYCYPHSAEVLNIQPHFPTSWMPVVLKSLRESKR